VGQKQSLEKENFGLSDNDNDVNEVCNEIEDLPSSDKNLLKLMWKAMQEDKIERERDRKDRAEQERIRRESEEGHERDRKDDRAEQERIRRESEERMERLERNRKEHWERLEQIIGQFKKSVETCKERASKPAGDIPKL
jgi:hypothetical protein